MIRKLSTLKYWELVTLGLCLSVTAVLAVAGSFRLIRDTWPQTAEATGIAYFVISAAVAWAMVGVFSEAIMIKRRGVAVEAAMLSIASLLQELETAAAEVPEEVPDRG